MSDPRTELAEQVRFQGFGCGFVGSPMYEQLCDRLADDVEAGGPTWRLLEPYALAPFGDAYTLRLLGGTHRLALSGDAPELARHYPSAGGDGDVDGAWRALHALVDDPPPVVLDALARPPQTNEVGRSASLIGGFLTVARATGLALRVLEIGASAGLNLRFDRYRYEQGAATHGPPDSTVRFDGLWAEGIPPFDAPLHVAERRGCDRDPINPRTPEGRLTLLSYVWPDQHERFVHLRAALDLAQDVDAPVDREDVATWLPAQLAEPRPGVATVVFHSIVWQYLGDGTRARVRGVLSDAGGRATPDAPLAWLRVEPPHEAGTPEVRLTRWPGAEDDLLATCTYHLGPVQWRAGANG